MNKKIIAMIVLLMVLSTAASASAVVSVGVKKGDWIEYNATYTGTPPEGHDVNWARMEILNVQGAEITLNITTRSPNGEYFSETVTLNLETGELGDDFIIPANLKDVDEFFDKTAGNITIGSVESRTYAGATRVVVIGSKQQSIDYWDQSTGVLLEGNSTFADYTMITKVDKTNLWVSQQAGLDQTILIALALVAIIVVVIAVVFVARRKKK